MSEKNNPPDVSTDFDKYKDRHSENPIKLIRKGYIKWIIIAACVVIAITLFVIPIILGNRAKPILMPADIKEVTVYYEGTANTTFSYTDAEKINRLADYLTSLKLHSTTRTPYGPQEFYSGEWQITITGKEGVCGVKIVGNKFFQHPDGTWWTITDEQASDFEELIKTMKPDKLPSSFN